MRKKALITGITGQDGAYLANFLLKKNYKIIGFLGRRVNQSFYNLDYLGIKDKISYIHGDITDSQSIINAMEKHSEKHSQSLTAAPGCPRWYLSPVS